MVAFHQYPFIKWVLFYFIGELKATFWGPELPPKNGPGNVPAVSNTRQRAIISYSVWPVLAASRIPSINAVNTHTSSLMDECTVTRQKETESVAIAVIGCATCS